jgi:flagellar protein FlgJ
MSVSIGSDQLYTAANMMSSNVKAEELKEKIENSSATDEELMDVCKSFESYLLEQVMKAMKKTVPKDEGEENAYLEQFGDKLYEEYAYAATESKGLGIAQMLYESMKRNA